MAAALPPETPLSEIAFTVLDTETTGVNLEHGHEIIELGMVRYFQGKISDTFSTLFRPTVPVSEPDLAINRIGLAELAIAPTFAEMAEVVIQFIGETVIAAHNFLFDLTFLDTSLHRLGRPPLGNWSFDTLRLSSELWPEYECHCLKCLGPSLKLSGSGNHRALEDATVTTGLLERIIEKLQQKGENSLRRLHPVRGDFTWKTGDIHRHYRDRLLRAIREEQPLTLFLYNRGGCFYSRQPLLPRRLDRGCLWGLPPGEKVELEIPLHQIISVNPTG